MEILCNPDRHSKCLSIMEICCNLDNHSKCLSIMEICCNLDPNSRCHSVRETCCNLNPYSREICCNLDPHYGDLLQSGSSFFVTSFGTYTVVWSHITDIPAVERYPVFWSRLSRCSGVPATSIGWKFLIAGCLSLVTPAVFWIFISGVDIYDIYSVRDWRCVWVTSDDWVTCKPVINSRQLEGRSRLEFDDSGGPWWIARIYHGLMARCCWPVCAYYPSQKHAPYKPLQRY